MAKSAPAVRSDAPSNTCPGEPGRCVARSVLEVLSAEPTLEAVTIDSTHQKVSLATMGRTDLTRLTERITRDLTSAQAVAPDQLCTILTGRTNCHDCSQPLASPDLRRISISCQGGATTIARVTCPTAPKFWRWSELPLPKFVPREIDMPVDVAGHDHADEWKWQLALAAACGVLGLLAGVFLPAYRIPLFVLSYLAGAWFPAEEVWERLQKRTLDVHFLMLAVAAGSASIGAWGEGATLLFLFSFSGALEHYALGRTEREIHSLFHDAPKTATVLEPDGRERETPVDQLRPGTRLLVKPGAQFPVDVEIVSGRTAADESNLTGEAHPVEKTVGDRALAGTLNLWGAVEVIVLRPAAESALQKIVTLIKEAQRQKAPAQRFADRFSTYYTYGALALALAMFFVWWMVPAFPTYHHAVAAFYRTMTLLVVSSPCALVLSIPSAVLAAIARGAREGILFRGGAAVEKLAAIRVVALDKTGTLTTGELRVERVESFPPGHETEAARLACSLERLSDHPLARAITRYGKQQQLAPLELTGFESVTGSGLRATWNGGPVCLGRREWVAQQSPLSSPPAAPGEIGISEVWVAGPGFHARLVLRDDVRPQAAAVIEQLRAHGLRSVVLTGDRAAAAEHLRTLLKLDDVRAGLSPEQKVAAIRELSDGGSLVAMVGDGVNDAPSLAAAHVGVAMGARGSDAALEQADVVLMHDRLENFVAAFRLSQAARTVIRQNLVISLGTVVVLVVFALLQKIPLPVGVVGHEGSTVVVVMNSLRLLLAGNGRKPQGQS